MHKHQCSFSSVVHVILAAEQSKAECSRHSTAEHNTADQNSAHYSYSIAQHYSTLLVQHSTAQQSTAEHCSTDSRVGAHNTNTAQHSRDMWLVLTGVLGLLSALTHVSLTVRTSALLSFPVDPELRALQAPAARRTQAAARRVR